jgi:general secretion pathway protein K
VGLLTLLASAAAMVSVSHRRAAQRLAERATLTARADSAIRIALLRVVAPATGEVMKTGIKVQIETPAGLARVTVERERGRIDLNTADERLVLALFASNGWKQPQAREMAARIADWTDADDEPREYGAEVADYFAAGRPYGPRNGPFESVEELRQVLGSEAISPAIVDAVTVYTHQRIPPIATSHVVLNAMKYADERNPGEGFAPGPAVARDDGGALVGEVIRVRACTEPEAMSRCRLAVVRVTGSTQHPLQIFSWRDSTPRN